MSFSFFRDYTSAKGTFSPFLFLIGEVGDSCGMDENAAFSVVDKLADSGFSAAKFQIVLADELLLPEGGLQFVEGKKIDLYDRFKNQEKSVDFFFRLAQHCKKRNILFFSSVFGLESLKILLSIGQEMGETVVKIASPESHHLLLWREIAQKIDLIDGVIFSTGMTTRKDLDWLAEYWQRLEIPREKLCGLQCVTRYPALESESNVSILGQNGENNAFFGGLSDHSADPVFVCMLAAAYRASGGYNCFLEKHVCLDDRQHLDSTVAITSKSFSYFAKMTHSAYFWGMNYRIEDYSLAQWSELFAKEYGFDFNRVIAALGGENKGKIVKKEITKQEESVFLQTKRSLRCKKSKKANEEINLDDCLFLRPGSLPAGEGYLWLDKLLRGKKLVAKVNFPAGSQLNENNCYFVE